MIEPSIHKVASFRNPLVGLPAGGRRGVIFYKIIILDFIYINSESLKGKKVSEQCMSFGITSYHVRPELRHNCFAILFTKPNLFW